MASPDPPLPAHGRAGDHALAYRSLDRSLFQGPHIAAPNGGDWVPREEWHARKRGANNAIPTLRTLSHNSFARFLIA